MKRKTKIILLVALAIMLISYFVSDFIYILNHPYLTFGCGFGSDSMASSRKDQLYLGQYKPLRNDVRLKDGSVLKVQDAWAEHQFKYRTAVLYFIQVKQKTKGFYFVVPPLQGKQLQEDFKLVYFLALNKDDERFTDYPGFGFSDPLGFQVYLDELPKRIRFNVIQKENENDSWKDAKTVDTITYIKDF